MTILENYRFFYRKKNDNVLTNLIENNLVNSTTILLDPGVVTCFFTLQQRENEA